MIPVSVTGVYAQENDALPPQHFVVLFDEAGQRRMRIFVGQAEAWAISAALEKTVADRPMTYDFVVNALSAAGMKLDEVRIVALREETFYAVVKMRRGKTVKELDARPSDALALALRMDSPIFVAPDVLAAVELSPDEIKGVELGTLWDADEAVRSLVGEAVGADEMRLEPEETLVRIRKRVGDEWREMATVSHARGASLVERLKLLAGLDIAQTQTPQTGRIAMQYNGKDYTEHVTAELTEWGERVVIRIESA